MVGKLMEKVGGATHNEGLQQKGQEKQFGSGGDNSGNY